MTDLHESFVRRKARLVARCEGQPARLGCLGRDRALAVGHVMRERPVLTGVAVAAAVALRGHGPSGIAGRALAAWRIWRSLASWAGRLGLIAPLMRRRRAAGDAAL